MLKQLNNFILRLWRDDDGVVLALTVVVYLTLFVIGCSVFAVGEHLRLRIVLQNAADAAAYSTAVVQADAISRIAALNRAMAWDYAQVCKMKRECILDKWVNDVYNAWKANRKKARNKARKNCDDYDDRWYAGNPNWGWEDESINFNGTWFEAQEILAIMIQVEQMGRSHNVLSDLIKDLLESIDEIYNKERKIITSLASALYATFRIVCEQNLDAGTRILLLRENPRDYFEELPSTQEAENSFLSYAIGNTAFEEFGPGTDDWFILENSSRTNGDGVHIGFSRNCTGSENLRPTATWSYGWERWRKSDGVCTLKDWKDRDGEPLRASRYSFRREIFAYPHRLTDGFFSGDGTLVVAVASRLRNPLSVMMSSLSQPGIFGFFTPSSTREDYMWAVAAARAGYRVPGGDPEPGSSEDLESRGYYAVIPDHGDLRDDWGKVNLGELDWDAVLLPLQRARSAHSGNSWASASGHDILGDIWESDDWQVVGGGSATQLSIKKTGGDIPNYSDSHINQLIWH